MGPDQTRKDNGEFGENRETPDRKKAIAGLVALGSAGALAISSGAGGAGAGTAAESVGVPKNLSAKVKQGKESARKGKSDDAWRKMDLKRLKRESKNAADCAINSYGKVRDFFLHNPCKSLDRTLFTLADPAGNTFVVSVSWVRMRKKADVADLKSLIDTDGTGSVKSLGFELLHGQGVRFTGSPFKSDPHGDQLTIAEAAVVSGHPDQALVTATVEVAAELLR